MVLVSHLICLKIFFIPFFLQQKGWNGYRAKSFQTNYTYAWWGVICKISTFS